jgi:pilus assembly protein CpaB
MRGRTVVLFAMALLFAGGTAVLMRSWLSHRPTVVIAPPPPAPIKSVLVARVAIERGQILKSGDFAWRAWPDSAITSEFIVSGGSGQQAFVGWVARERFVADEPILKSKMLAPGDRGFLAAVLNPGMRAVSIAVDQIGDVSGFIFPGDRVDLLVDLSLPTEGAAGAGYQYKAAETVLRDIRVLAVDQRLDSKDGQAVLARTVTLEVTPKESEVAMLAAEMGKLALSLCSLSAKPRPEPGRLALAGASALVANEPADSITGRGPDSFTLDSQISPLVPQPTAIKHNPNDGKVTILRGNGNSGTSAGSQSGS